MPPWKKQEAENLTKVYIKHSIKLKNIVSSAAAELSQHPETAGEERGDKGSKPANGTTEAASKSQSGSNKKVDKMKTKVNLGLVVACSDVSRRFLSSRSSDVCPTPGPSQPPIGTKPQPSSPSGESLPSAAPQGLAATRSQTEAELRSLEPGALTLEPARFCDPGTTTLQSLPLPRSIGPKTEKVPQERAPSGGFL